MNPKELIRTWVELFNRADHDALSEMYHEDAVNHQVALEPVSGKENIRKMFRDEFSRAKMVCIVERVFSDENWGILEWKDPNGLRGCGFFEFQGSKIKLQRGYWDQLTFLRAQGLPLPTE